MRENVENCCRVCLDTESDHVPIFEEESILLHIQSCLTIEISADDRMPKEICIHCVSLLRQFYNFQMSARCSQDWLESVILENSKKPLEAKIQPLPNSEYNSDSLLEFLNNTTNIDEYLRNLGKDDIPSIVNMLDKNPDQAQEPQTKCAKPPKSPSPRKKEPVIKLAKDAIKVDVLESDFDIVKEILIREAGQCGNRAKTPQKIIPKLVYNCYACKMRFERANDLSQHLITCDTAIRTCWHCNALFESKYKLFDHIITHVTSYPVTCNCGKKFTSKLRLLQHFETCNQKHMNGLKLSYRCKKCGVVYDDRVKLYNHAKSHIIKAQRKTCDICLLRYKDDKELLEHKRNDHNITRDAIHRCKICGHTSTDKIEMYNHVQKHILNEIPRMHLCDSCGRSFTTRASLLRHVAIHQKENISHEQGNETLSGCGRGKVLAMCDRCGLTLDSNKLPLHICSNGVSV